MAIHFADAGYTAEDFNFDNVDVGGLPEPGVYHVKLVKVESQDDGQHTPSENLTFSILTGNVAGQGGKQITERLYLQGKDEAKTKKAIARAMGFGKRMGVYSKADAEACKPIELERGVGKEFIIELDADTYTDNNGNERQSVRMSYMGIWGLDHPDAPSCPRQKNGKIIPAAGKVEPAKPAAAKAPPKKPAAASVDNI